MTENEYIITLTKKKEKETNRIGRCISKECCIGKECYIIFVSVILYIKHKNYYRKYTIHGEISLINVS
jgi:hypothetical protein